MEIIWFDVYSYHVFLADFDSLEVHFFVESSVDFKSCFGRCGGDEIDDGCVIVEWFFFPVHANKAEKSMFDFVPFACAWRIMRNRDGESGLVCKRLEFSLPVALACNVPAGAVGSDEEPRLCLVYFSSEMRPPLSNDIDGELCS